MVHGPKAPARREGAPGAETKFFNQKDVSMSKVRTEILKRVEQAREAYQCRYTMRQLKAVDPDLYQAIRDQDDDFTLIAITADSDADVVDYGESTIRGWTLARERMDDAAEPEGVCLIGLHDGTAVVISENKKSMDRMREQYPQAVHMTPEEVAQLVAGMETVAAVKRAFEGAEITAVRQKSEQKERGTL